MRTWMFVFGALAVVALVTPAGAQLQTQPSGPANYIVVPGHAIGDIHLGMTQQQVLNRLGMPDEISNDRSGDGSLNVYWIYPQGERAVFVVSWTKRQNDAGGVDFLFTDAPRYVTSRGIAMQNSSFKDILAQYGAPDRLQGGGRGSVVLHYEGQGIRFRVEGESGRVTAITVVPRK